MTTEDPIEKFNIYHFWLQFPQTFLPLSYTSEVVKDGEIPTLSWDWSGKVLHQEDNTLMPISKIAVSLIVTWRAGSEENSGQIVSEGVPRRSTISSNWPSSERPGKSGRCPKSSPSIQPAAHMSTDVVWVRACNSSSGARYHRVTTRGVIGRKGRPNQRAKPKSATKIKVKNLETVYEHNMLVCSAICLQARAFQLKSMDWVQDLKQN